MPPVYFEPGRFVVSEGLLGFYTSDLADNFDVRVYLDPPEELRRHWKVQRDCSRRGYTTDQVLSELDRREPDSERYIRPQRHHADIIIAFQPSGSRGPGASRLQADAPRHARAPGPTGVVATDDEDGIVLVEVRAPSSFTFPASSGPSARPHRRGDLGEDALRGHLARSGSVSSRSAPTSTAPTRSPSSSC